MAPVTFTQRSQIGSGQLIAAGPVGDCLDKLQVGVNLVDDTQLASPTSAVWRTVAQCEYGSGIAGLSTTPCYVGGSAIIASGGAGNAVRGLWIPDSADIAVAGKTTRLRVRSLIIPNTINPSITITWGLYPITAISGATSAGEGLTLGTVIAGSTAALAPTASTPADVKGSSFDISAVTGGLGGYVLGLVGSGAQNANSNVACTTYLEMRHT